MNAVPDSIIEAAIRILATPGIEEDSIKREVRELVDDDMTARRLVDWLPEAFGVVFVSHICSKIILPTTFSARSRNGDWTTFKLVVEPIFVSTVQIAQRMFHEGPREAFERIANRSAMTRAVNKALTSGVHLDGACFSGPALIGIPAEVYPSPPKRFWQRLLLR